MRRALLLLAACSHVDHGPRYRAAGATVPRAGGVLRFSCKDQTSTLDPAYMVDEVSGYTAHALFDTLVAYTPGTTRLEPGLAQSWDVSPDGLVYTFHLRDGLTYSDGTAVAPEDFQYSLERVKALPDSPFPVFVADVTLIATAPRQVTITLARPNASFLNVMAMIFTTPQKKTHVEAADDQMRREPLGTGPFTLASWDEGQQVVLAKNPHYWNAGAIHLDGIEMLENIPRDTQFLMFERGELDVAERLAPPDLLWVQDQPEWKPFVHRTPLMVTYGSRMNVTKKPFDDRRVRQALNYALDKGHTIKLLQGEATIAHGILPPGVPGRDDALAPYPHDPAKARALLADAGYPNGFDTEYVIVNDSEAERLAGSLQADLAEVGVRVHITEMSIGTYLTALGSRSGPPFAKAGALADFPDAADFFDANFSSKSIADENSNNWAFYSTPELDALLDAARGERDSAKREAMYHQAERIVYDDAPWLWDYHQIMTEVRQPYVKDFEPHPVWIRDYTRAWLDLGPHGERLP